MDAMYTADRVGYKYDNQVAMDGRVIYPVQYT